MSGFRGRSSKHQDHKNEAKSCSDDLSANDQIAFLSLPEFVLALGCEDGLIVGGRATYAVEDIGRT